MILGLFASLPLHRAAATAGSCDLDIVENSTSFGFVPIILNKLFKNAPQVIDLPLLGNSEFALQNYYYYKFVIDPKFVILFVHLVYKQ